ncbi:MAG: CocE/NonD family hydrolase [Stenotrophobium sp.]
MMKTYCLLMTLLLGAALSACGGSGQSGGGQTVVSAADSSAASSSSGGTASQASADGALTTSPLTFTASDGVQLRAYISGNEDSSSANFPARPLIVEFSPYAPTSFSSQNGQTFGPAYNYLEVNARGTGLSGGVWGAVGPRDQQDVSEFLAWACKQPWSNGHIGLYGFSASAIAIYNSLHLPLACVDAASLMAGSDDLYRDLLYPGGMFNLGPATVVAFGVGAPLAADSFGAIGSGTSPITQLQTGAGLLGLFVDILSHATEDSYWTDRTERRDPAGPNTFPVLADTSFYDPEPRGPFESFKLLRSLGVQIHLITFGAHDGFPATTPGPFPQYQRWFDHYLLGVDNGIDSDPAVQLLLGNGGRDALRAGNFTRVDASDWPVPGTRWQKLFLDPAKSGSATSINDGSLAAAAPAASTTQVYPALVSVPTATDPDTTSTVGVMAFGGYSINTLFDMVPILTQMKLTEAVSLTYTTPAFSQPVDVAGQGSLDVFASSILPETDLYAVVSDVWPDGTAYAVGVGRLRSSSPNIDRSRSVIDPSGEIVQPYGDYSIKTAALPLQTREYHVEFWPIGNHFAAGHRLRLTLVGTSAYMLPSPGLLNLVSIGGATPSRLLLPVLPGSDALAAMGENP